MECRHLDIMASAIVEVEGSETKYKEATTIHEKYANRPPAIENICLAQFYANYDMSTSKKKYKIDAQGAAGYSDSRKIISWNADKETYFR